MTDQDASFADGDPSRAKKLALKAEDAEGLAVISALLQDAVGKTTEIAWMPKRRIFAMVVNRFRWEDAEEAAAESREFERIRTGLHAENVLKVRAQGFDPKSAQQAFELLALSFEPGEDGTGVLNVTCAGGGSFAIEVEALDVRMSDMDAVWRTKQRPVHEEDA